ncbi:MAG: hypothetical protein P8X90_18530 [Desulfobacterales bacterium]
MKASTKAMFLSALVYPGAGQFALGAVFSGAFFSALTTGGLLVFLYRFSRRIYPVADQIVTALATFKLNPGNLIEMLGRSAYNTWRVDAICVIIILCCWAGSAGHAFWLGKATDRGRDDKSSR